MYIPGHYLNENHEETLSFMRRFNFATLITAVGDVPTATHLPFVVSEKEGSILLTSHMAKANPHGEQLAEKESLVVFSEPHAYISPRHYEQEQNVPTWNYMAVHAYGRTRLIHDEKAAFDVLEKMINCFEAAYKKQWDSLSSDYKKRMVKGITAFEIEVSRIESKKKLSQNKKDSERASIIQELSKSESGNEKTLARFMKKNEE